MLPQTVRIVAKPWLTGESPSASPGAALPAPGPSQAGRLAWLRRLPHSPRVRQTPRWPGRVRV